MGLTPTTWGVEQYTITINLYAATTDLNMVTERVGIASQFLQNAYVNGEQAARSLDELAATRCSAPISAATRGCVRRSRAPARRSPLTTCAASRPYSSMACSSPSAAARR